jgi:hypothetical protein
MTYPRNLMPDGPVHPRAYADPWNPLGGFLCRRCESYRERRGVLPDNATLQKLVANYLTEVAKSNLRAADQPVICENCGDVEGPDGLVNSANGFGVRHIASNGVVRCAACDTYVRVFGKERDHLLAARKATRDQATADRAAGRPVRCKHCGKAEPVGAGKGKRWTSSKQGGLVCRTCYDSPRLRLR